MMVTQSDMMFLAILAVLLIFCYRQSKDRFEPAPACPFRAEYGSPDATPDMDMKQLADAAMLATPPMPSPMAELFDQRAFWGTSSRTTTM